MEAGKEMGLHGNELLQFVTEQQKLEREERTKEIEREEKAKEVEREKRAKETEQEEKAKEREREEKAKETEREEKAKERERAALRAHELELLRLKLEYEAQMEKIKNQQSDDKQTHSINGLPKLPKLPVFDDSKDTIDAYLERFERYANIQQWERGDWAIALSALLSGKTLEVYARLSSDEAMDYTKVKSALLKRYNLIDRSEI